MSFQKFKYDFYCVGGRHPSATTNLYDDITIVQFVTEKNL